MRFHINGIQIRLRDGGNSTSSVSKCENAQACACTRSASVRRAARPALALVFAEFCVTCHRLGGAQPDCMISQCGIYRPKSATVTPAGTSPRTTAQNGPSLDLVARFGKALAIVPSKAKIAHVRFEFSAYVPAALAGLHCTEPPPPRRSWPPMPPPSSPRGASPTRSR